MSLSLVRTSKKNELLAFSHWYIPHVEDGCECVSSLKGFEYEYTTSIVNHLLACERNFHNTIEMSPYFIIGKMCNYHFFVLSEL